MLLCVFAKSVCGPKGPDQTRDQFFNSGGELFGKFCAVKKNSSSPGTELNEFTAGAGP